MASAPTKEIGDRTYAFGKFNVADATHLQIALMRWFLDPLGRLITIAGRKGAPAVPLGVDAEGKTVEVSSAEIETIDPNDAEVLGGAIRAFCAVFTAVEVEANQRKILKSVTVVSGEGVSQSHDAVYDTDFIGRPLELWQVCIAAIQENFGGFFRDARFRSLLLRLRRALESKAPISTGS